MVLVYYLPPDFEGDEKPKGDPWKSKKFLLRGVDESGWKGVSNLLKRSSIFFINEKIKFLNLVVDNRQVS